MSRRIWYVPNPLFHSPNTRDRAIGVAIPSSITSRAKSSNRYSEQTCKRLSHFTPNPMHTFGRPIPSRSTSRAISLRIAGPWYLIWNQWTNIRWVRWMIWRLLSSTGFFTLPQTQWILHSVYLATPKLPSRAISSIRLDGSLFIDIRWGIMGQKSWVWWRM